MSNPQGLDNFLLQFGQDLKHSEQYEKDANLLINGVFRKLQSELKGFKVAEVHPFGSYGKKLDVIHSDLDLVIFINFDFPEQFENSRENILNQFHDILYLNQKLLKIPSKNIEKKKNIIAFTFENGIEVDLNVAGMFPKDVILNEISKDPKRKAHMYSPCLVKLSLDFMRAQDSFAHSLVRVFRFWYKLLYVNAYGGKLMIDLIGVAAAMKEKDSQSMLRGLATAFRWISNLDTLKLAFIEERGNWRQVTSRELSQRSFELLQNRVIGTQEILNRKGFIIDPSNPFNDLLVNVKDDVMTKLKRSAGVMGDRLAKAQKFDSEFVFYSHAENKAYLDIFKLFSPKPNYLREIFPKFRCPDEILINYKVPVTSPYPDLKVWNESTFKKLDVQGFVNAFKWDLLARVNSIPSQIGMDASNEQEFELETTRKVVKKMVETTLGTKLVPAGDQEEQNCDLTISVPYQIRNDYYAVKINLGWI